MKPKREDRRPPGRPSKLTVAVQARIVEALEAGQFLATAARAAGVHPSTVRRWVERGEAEEQRRTDGGAARVTEQPFHAFAAAVEQADATAEGRAVATITASPDWRAAAWYLERRHPTTWGGRAAMFGQGEPEPAVADPCEGLDLTVLTDAELDEFRRMLTKATA